MRALRKVGVSIIATFLWMIMAGAAWPVEIEVKISGGFRAAYNKLKPQFEERTGHKLVTVGGASSGTTANAIPARLKRGEPADVVIVTRGGLDRLVKEGHVVAGSEVDLGRSLIGLAVQAGASVPDISTVDALKQVLVAAKTVAYIDSGSGVCVASCQIFRRLGIDSLETKYTKFNSITELGAAVARGDAEVGLHVLSELLPVPGVYVVGPIPDAVQVVITFSAGVATKAKSPIEAKALIEYLASRESGPVIEESGLRPVSR